MPSGKPARRRVATLTMNPAVDLSVAVDRLSPTGKLRCHDVRRDPGGGGVNVARVLRRLGTTTVAVIPAGGPAGDRLAAMLRAERTPHMPIAIAGETREDFTALEAASGQQYRFVLPGPRLSAAECARVLEAVADLRPRPAIVVASGSLPPGAPLGVYARLAAWARRAGVKLALDTAGKPLKLALAEGVWLAKPNLAELEELVGAPLPDMRDRLAACCAIVQRGGAELVALSMGAQGALLVSATEAWRATAPRLTALSTVGAGDSFMAGLIDALAAGETPRAALVRAVAAGSAALMAPGVQLCRTSDVVALSKRVRAEPVWLASAPSATPPRPAAA